MRHSAVHFVFARKSSPEHFQRSIGWLDTMAPKSPEHDPEKWKPVFPRDKREAFARRSCSNKEPKRDDDSKKSHPALAGSVRHGGLAAFFAVLAQGHARRSTR
jgi:hypothetical protein